MADTVGSASVELTVDDSKARKGLKGLFSNIKSFGASAKSVFAGTLAASAAIKGIGLIKTGIGGLIKAGMDYNATQDKMRATWTTLAGSAAKGKQMVDMVNNFQVKTGYATETLNEMEQKIYHIKSSASQTQVMTKAFTTLGDAMGLSDDRLEGVAEQFSQMMSSGKAYTGDLNIMTNAFPAFGENIEKVTGKSMGQIRNLASQGKLSSQVVQDTLIEMGHKYSDATENAMGTTQGLWRTIQSNWGRISGTMLKPIFNLKKSGLKDLSDFLSGDQVTNFAKNFGNAIAGAIGGIIDLSTAIAKSLSPLVSAFSEGFTNGFGKMQTDAETFAAFLGNAFYNLISTIGKAKTVIEGVFDIATGKTGKGVSILASLGLSPAQIQQVIQAINTLKSFISASLNNIVTGIKMAGQFIIAAWNIIWPYLKPGITAIFNFVKSIIAQLQTFWKQNGAVITQAIKNVMTVILAILRVAMPIIAAIVSGVWDNVKGVIQGALNIIMGLIKIFAGLFTGNWKTMWSGVKQLFSGAITFIWNAVNLLMLGRILKGAKAFGTAFKGFFKTMWAGVKTIWKITIDAIDKLVSADWAAIKAVTTGTFNAIKSFLSKIWSGIKSLVSNSANGVWNGVKSAWNSIKTHTSSIFTGIKKTIANVWDDIVSGAKKLPGRIGNGIKSMASKAVSGVKSLANTLAKWVGKGVNGVINGVDWVLNKIGIKGKPIPTWPVPAYKSGTGGHPTDGPAVVGDGGEQEFVIDDGKVSLSPARATLTWLKKGAQVISGPITKRILSGELPFPAYASGIGSIGSAISNGVKSAASTVKNVGINVFDYVTHPSKLLGDVLSKMGFSLPKMAGGFGKVALGAVRTVKDKATTFVKNKVKGLLDFGATKVSGSVSNWIDAAIGVSGVSGSAWKAGLAWIIQHESSGNPNAIGAMTSTGTAKGLMQLMDFNIGGNPFNPINNIHSGIKYIKSRYKTIQNAVAFWKSHNWYGNGTSGHKGGDAVLGDNYRQEPYITPDGSVGLSPARPTLFKALPKGTQVWSSIGKFMKRVPHYASGTNKAAANKIAWTRANYSAGKIGASTYIADLKAIQKEYKLTDAQHRSLMVNIASAEKKLSNQRQTSTKKAEAARKKREKEHLAAVKKAASNRIASIETSFSTGKISASKYIAELKNVRKEYKLDGDQSRKITKDIYNAHQKIVAALKAEKAAQASVNKSVQSDSTAYLKKVQSINSTLQKNIQSAKDDYAKQLSDQTNSVYSQVGLFDSPDNTVSYKQDLTYSLKEQLQEQKQFTTDLNNLAKKTPASFVTELRNMGIGSASQIHALTTMTSKELNDYVSMWKQKHTLAANEAAIELEPAKASMNATITSLKKSAESELAQAKTDFVNKLKGLIPEVSKMGSLKNKSSALGKYAVSGLISGLKSMDGPLAAQAKSLAKTIESTIKKTLKIHSPSRVTFGLGQFIGEGLHQGISNMVSNVRDAAQQMSLAAIPAVPSASAMGNVVTSFAAAVGGSNSSGSATSEKPIFNFYGDMHIHNDDDYDQISKKLYDRFSAYQTRNRGRS